MIRREDWAMCETCQKYYLCSLDAILDRREKPLLCPQNHSMTWYPSSTRSQLLEALYLLLESRFITMQKVISFAQVEYSHEVIEKLKELENA